MKAHYLLKLSPSGFEKIIAALPDHSITVEHLNFKITLKVDQDISTEYSVGYFDVPYPDICSHLKVTKKSPYAFLAFPHSEGDEGRRLIDEAVKPALQNAGIDYYRPEEDLGPRPIMSKIINHITNSNLVIADLTGFSPNVAYEAGFADAVTKDIIFIQKEGKMIPFDFSGRTVIMYKLERLEALKAQLQQAIKERIKATAE